MPSRLEDLLEILDRANLISGRAGRVETQQRLKMLHRLGLDRGRIPLRLQTGVESRRCHDDDVMSRRREAFMSREYRSLTGTGIRDSGFGIRDRDWTDRDRGPWTGTDWTVDRRYGLKNVNSRPADMTPIHASSDTPPASRAANGGGTSGGVSSSRLNIRA